MQDDQKGEGGKGGSAVAKSEEGRGTGEPEFAQEAMKYVTGMMDVSA